MARLRFSSLGILLALALPLNVQADCMGPYPPSMVKTFNESCAKDQGMAPFCSCIMDGIQKNIPLADFIEISNTTGINTDPRFIKVSQKCSSKMSDNSSSAGSSPAQSAPAASGGVGLIKPSR